MKFRTLVLLLTICGVGLLSGSALMGAAAKKKPVAAAKKGAVTGKTASGKKPAVAGTAARRRTATKGTTKSPARTSVGYVPRQSAPTPERLTEIQSALASKGYLQGEPTGVWDAQSVDAMKRYQADQKFDASGRITAASLIGLGLGPKTAALPPAMPVPSGVPSTGTPAVSTPESVPEP